MASGIVAAATSAAVTVGGEREMDWRRLPTGRLVARKRGVGIGLGRGRLGRQDLEKVENREVELGKAERREGRK